MFEIIVLYELSVVICIPLALVVVYNYNNQITLGDATISVIGGLIPIFNIILVIVLTLILADKNKFFDTILYPKRKE